MSKYIITNTNINNKNIIFHGLHNGKSFYEVNVYSPDEDSILGNIYIGRVQNIVTSINAAFVEYAQGKVGYYSLEENKHIKKLVQGDEIIVQVEKDAIKTKDPVLTSKINLTGKYVAITINKSGIGISGKITDNNIRDALKIALKPYSSNEYGIVVRTNAANADISKIIEELKALLEFWNNILQKSKTRTKFTVLHKREPEYLTRIQGIYNNEIEEIVTDDEYIHNTITEKNINCHLYNDELLPLHKLYNVEGTLLELTSKKVWLKCGGYIIIEPTEAMVVIDVNSGKFAKGKNLKNSILKVNMEAATEIARQIRLRNLSGIIIVDFINMEDVKYKKQVIDTFKEIITKDPVKTDIVDMTKLNLLEITRKKVKAPVYEVLSN